MSDLLVRLYDLPPAPLLGEADAQGVILRRALAPEKRLVLSWVATHFSAAWADECDVAFSRQPLACFLATHGAELCGFAAYDAVCLNFFGPLGIHPEQRGRGLGRQLLLAALHAMRQAGYGYAIIGAAGPVDFFKKTVGAMEIAGSAPGIYRGLLRAPRSV